MATTNEASLELFKGLSENFQAKNLSLTAVLQMESFNYAGASQFLDMMHLPKGSIETVKKAGVPPSKTILNIPISAVKGIHPEIHTHKENIALRHDEVCAIESNSQNVILNKTFVEGFDRMFLEYSDENGKIFQVLYDSTRSIAQTTRYAMRNDLRGISIFSIDLDDAQGICDFETDTFDGFEPVDGVNLRIPSRYDKTQPLLRTVNDAIVVALDEIEQENQLKKKRPNQNSNSNRPGEFFANWFYTLFNRPQGNNTRINNIDFTE